MTEFRMPSLGADMDEATLLEWLVKPGDPVHKGDVIAVVDTVKAAMDVEVFTDGFIEALLVQPGTTVAVGTLLATIGDTASASTSATPAAPVAAAAPGHVVSPLVRHLAEERHVDLATVVGSGPDDAITRADVEAAAAPTAVAMPVTPVPAVPTLAASNGLRASPMARRRAAELDIDLAQIGVGTGPDGAITADDVERAARPTAPTRRPEADRAKGMRQATAALMARSKREIPHYYLSADIDLHRALTWLDKTNAGRPVEQRLVVAALLLKSAALAARHVPEMNGFWADGEFSPSPQIHLGVAISMRQGGLIAPAIHDADTLPVEVLMQKLRDLVSRARTGRLRQSEMADPTITVTNLGDLGVEAVWGVIYPPQVAVVGFGRVADRPCAIDGLLGVRPFVTATLSGDHRVSDGHRGGRYLARIDELLQKPEEL